MASRNSSTLVDYALSVREFYESKSDSQGRIRGRRIANKKQCLVQELDLDKQKASFVINKNGQHEGLINIANYLDGNFKIESSYTSADGSLLDENVIAALMVLEQALEKWQDLQTGVNINDTRSTTLEIDKISSTINYANTTAQNVNRAEILIKYDEVKLIDSSDPKRIEFKIFDSTKYVNVVFERSINQNILSSCSCSDISYKLCQHKVAALMYFKNLKGDYAFQLMKDHTANKNDLLQEYGYSLDDDIEGKFAFYFEDGEVKLQVRDKKLKKISNKEQWSAFSEILSNNSLQLQQLSIFEQTQTEKTSWGRGFGIAFYNLTINTPDQFPGFQFIALAGKLDDSGRRFRTNIAHIDQAQQQALPQITDAELQLEDALRFFDHESISKWANNKFKKKFVWSKLNAQERYGCLQYVSNRLKQVFPLLKKAVFGHLKDPSLIKMANFQPLEIIDETPELCFELVENEKFLELKPFIIWENIQYPLNEFTQKASLFLIHERFLFLIDSIETASILEQFKDQAEIRLSKADFLEFYKSVLINLQSKYKVEINTEINFIEEKIKGKPKVILSEIDNFLCLTPIMAYNEHEVAVLSKEDILYQNETEEIIKVVRNEEEEKAFEELIIGLHPSFGQIEDLKGALFLPYNEVIRNNWFLNITQQLRKANIDLIGYEHLLRFRLNLNKPEVLVMANSGIDWFDIEIKIRFGDQELDIKDLQKALKKKQNTIQLADGTIGVIPEDFINKNAVLLKLGEVEGDKLKVSNLHFSLVEQLFQEYGKDEYFPEIEMRREQLAKFDKIETQPIPQEVKAELRDYQISGYSWLCFLDEFKWGGCIADDMGLGKTLQVLTFLQKKINEQPDKTHLVILPTTLIFNWQNEINKFCPNIKSMVHRGTQRDKHTDNFADYNLVITTYGILVRDIGMLSEYNFGYIVLDESQAIKNPNSKRYKAVRLLKAENRIVLTGTPVENNTFDLYAQMNFLNPGLLGGVQFFKEEFSTPIDRYDNQGRMDQLKRLIYPFLLRRTKKQVAAELPEKTESVLYCEMPADQRQIYDNFKKHYRQRILKKIEQDGLRKSSFFVLEGLLKLRQICDSPALLSDNDAKYDGTPVKIDSLLDNITEKMHEHKILVFSQFVGMLQLVRQKLDENGIIYEYLDGSTRNRKQRVNRFQNDEFCRVFLISLKAGGVGINLTEADYVFLLDPWWNPAVEAQAIDRTHRIGQTKKVFSYKLICKDTIEEKVLKLQEKKKALVSDLISPENNFFKQLDQEDVMDLFA